MILVNVGNSGDPARQLCVESAFEHAANQQAGPERSDQAQEAKKKNRIPESLGVAVSGQTVDHSSLLLEFFSPRSSLGKANRLMTKIPGRWRDQV